VRPDLAKAALDYAERGWPVVPLNSWTGSSCTCGCPNCSSPAKHPRTAHGLKDGTVVGDEVVSWWHRWPDANIGLLTGVAFDVLDIDGAEGMAAINAAAPWYGEPWDGGPTDNPTIDGPTSQTGRGWHVLIAPTGLGNRAGVLKHVDWRGGGGYIVGPPSLHANGHRYEWFPGWGPDDQAVRPAPSWLLAILRKPATFALPGARRPQPDEGAYGRAALEREIGRVAIAPVGERNQTLNRAAFAIGQLIAGRAIADGTGAVQALLNIGRTVGLGDEEVVATVKSGIEAGFRQPRRTPRSLAS
jgi:hypothetical protein